MKEFRGRFLRDNFTEKATNFVPIQAVSYEEIFPRNFGVGGVKNFLGKKHS